MSETVISGHVLVGKHALVVDDDDDARGLLRDVLESVRMIVCEADCVEEALSKLYARTFNLIVSDIGMPGRDGYSFMRTVRGRPDGCVVRTLSLTSFVQAEDRALALSAGSAPRKTRAIGCAHPVSGEAPGAINARRKDLSASASGAVLRVCSPLAAALIAGVGRPATR